MNKDTSGSGKFEYFLDLLVVLVGKELKIRYKSTVFGYLWSVASPFVFALTFFVAFKNVMKIEIENYLVFLLIGMFPWQFFSNSVTQAPFVFLGNANLIKKVTFPRFMLAIALLGNNAIHFLLALPVLFGFMLFHGVYLTLDSFAFIIVLFVNQSILAAGCILFLGTANLFFRDMENLTMVVTNLLFYVTPIIYPASSMPQQYQWLLMWNPMSQVVELWHQLLLKNIFNWELFVTSFIYNLCVFYIGWFLYRQKEKRFAEIV